MTADLVESGFKIVALWYWHTLKGSKFEVTGQEPGGVGHCKSVVLRVMWIDRCRIGITDGDVNGSGPIELFKITFPPLCEKSHWIFALPASLK